MENISVISNGGVYVEYYNGKHKHHHNACFFISILQYLIQTGQDKGFSLTRLRDAAGASEGNREYEIGDHRHNTVVTEWCRENNKSIHVFTTSTISRGLVLGAVFYPLGKEIIPIRHRPGHFELITHIGNPRAIIGMNHETRLQFVRYYETFDIRTKDRPFVPVFIYNDKGLIYDEKDAIILNIDEMSQRDIKQYNINMEREKITDSFNKTTTELTTKFELDNTIDVETLQQNQKKMKEQEEILKKIEQEIDEKKKKEKILEEKQKQMFEEFERQQQEQKIILEQIQKEKELKEQQEQSAILEQKEKELKEQQEQSAILEQIQKELDEKRKKEKDENDKLLKLKTLNAITSRSVFEESAAFKEIIKSNIQKQETISAFLESLKEQNKRTLDIIEKRQKEKDTEIDRITQSYHTVIEELNIKYIDENKKYMKNILDNISSYKTIFDDHITQLGGKQQGIYYLENRIKDLSIFIIVLTNQKNVISEVKKNINDRREIEHLPFVLSDKTKKELDKHNIILSSETDKPISQNITYFIYFIEYILKFKKIDTQMVFNNIDKIIDLINKNISLIKKELQQLIDIVKKTSLDSQAGGMPSDINANKKESWFPRFPNIFNKFRTKEQEQQQQTQTQTQTQPQSPQIQQQTEFDKLFNEYIVGYNKFYEDVNNETIMNSEKTNYVLNIMYNEYMSFINTIIKDNETTYTSFDEDRNIITSRSIDLQINIQNNNRQIFELLKSIIQQYISYFSITPTNINEYNKTNKYTKDFDIIEYLGRYQIYNVNNLCNHLINIDNRIKITEKFTKYINNIHTFISLYNTYDEYIHNNSLIYLQYTTYIDTISDEIKIYKLKQTYIEQQESKIKEELEKLTTNESVI